MAEAQLQLHVDESDSLCDTPISEEKINNDEQEYEVGEVLEDEDEVSDWDEAEETKDTCIDFSSGMRCPIINCSRANWHFANYRNYVHHDKAFHRKQTLYITCQLCPYSAKRVRDFKLHLKREHCTIDVK